MRRTWATVAFFLAGLLSPLGGGVSRANNVPESLEHRRSVRGTTIESQAESDELRDLRRFEEDAFGFHRKIEPAPARARAAGEKDPAPEPDGDVDRPAEAAWTDTLALPDMPVRWEPRVLRYLEHFKNDKRGRSIMASWLRKQGRYRELIERALEHYRLPKSLLYVAMIESGYDCHDRSSAGASGLWQMMPQGGKIYGLRIDHWVDERNDPEKATDAAMRYLGDLKARFGSWHLALAAFNAGYGAVLQSVAKYNTNDYWELSRQENGLPWETVNYVPKAMASAIVGWNRDAFGFGDVVPTEPFRFDRVDVGSSTSLANIAKWSGATLDAVALLNPELRRGRTPPGRWSVRIPEGSERRFRASTEKQGDSPGDRVATHTVQFGERIEAIARAYHVGTKDLKKLNGIKDSEEVRPGLVLVVPDPGARPSPVVVDGRDAEELIVAVPDAALEIPGRRRVFYKVVPGDQLGEVAAHFGVKPDDLRRWNHLDPDANLIGSLVLQIFIRENQDAAAVLLDPERVKLVTIGSDEFFDLTEARKGRRRLILAARKGDTLKGLGARYGLTEADMERINHMSRTVDIEEGQRIVAYAKVGSKDGAADFMGPMPQTIADQIAQAGGDPDDVAAAHEAPDPAAPARFFAPPVLARPAIIDLSGKLSEPDDEDGPTPLPAVTREARDVPREAGLPRLASPRPAERADIAPTPSGTSYARRPPPGKP